MTYEDERQQEHMIEAGNESTESTESTEPAAGTEAGTGAETGDGAFAALGLAEPLVAAVAALGYEEPTPIQREAIPPLIAGRDVLAEAPTGTGKTAAFALPLIQRIRFAPAAPGVPGSEAPAAPAPAPAWAPTPEGGFVRRPIAPITGLVIVPTRELAIQVAEAVHAYGRDLGIRVLPVYGGQAIGSQLRALSRGVDIVVATPGRAVDHINRGSMDLSKVRTVVLDEADEMLDMGFAEDLDTILTATASAAEGRQTALFSATFSPAITAIANRHLSDPVRLRVRRNEATASEAGATSRVRQVAYVVRGNEKRLALGRILDLEDASATLIFGRTRDEVEDLAESLSGRGHDAGALHGGLAQEQRDRIMARFREGSLDVLVATDVAARGLDIEHVTHVVNYDVPSNPESYVHRIGRTGRAGREGVAITLVEPREHRLLRQIEAATARKLEIGRLPTVADLRERRLSALASTLGETLQSDRGERYRGVVESLADEHDLVEIAMAALAMADEAERKPEEEVELAPAFLPSPVVGYAGRMGGPVGGPGGPHAAGRPGMRGPAPRQGFGPGMPPGRHATHPGAPAPRRGGPVTPGAPGSGTWTTLWVAGGRRAGMRPGDLVGAIANEAGVTGASIGAIRIDESYALVDVKPETADAIIAALGNARVKGRKVFVRRAHEG